MGINDHNYSWHQWGKTYQSALNEMMGFAFSQVCKHCSVAHECGMLSRISLQFVFLVPMVTGINACTFTPKTRASSDTDCFYLFVFTSLEG